MIQVERRGKRHTFFWFNTHTHARAYVSNTARNALFVSEDSSEEREVERETYFIVVAVVVVVR